MANPGDDAAPKPYAVTTPSGWYPDSTSPEKERYWDGSQWTEHVRAAIPPMPPPDASQDWAFFASSAPAMAVPADSAKWLSRHKVLTGVGAVLLVAGIAALAGGGGRDEPRVYSPPPPADYTDDALMEQVTYQVNDCTTTTITNRSAVRIALFLRANGQAGQYYVEPGATVTEPFASSFWTHPLDEKALAIGGPCPVVLYTLGKATPPRPQAPAKSGSKSCNFLRDSLAMFQGSNPGPQTAAEETEYDAIQAQMRSENC